MDDRTARRQPAPASDDHPRTHSGIVPADNAAKPAIAIGTVLDGKYRISRIVGAGAVGVVLEAQNLELGERVAIKCPRPEILTDRAMVARFAREAKAAAAIKSEYAASVYDVGTTPDGVPYIVMEYLDGKDLGTILEEGGRFAPRAAVEYALQVCEALAIAHSKGIVHRDIKPENLLLTERAGGMKIVKVLDFGISKAALTGSIFGGDIPLVQTVNLMGTPMYMSPEQVRSSDRVDVRSDIWSVGQVIYEVLTGETAFRGTTIPEICAAILEHQPMPISQHRSDVPAGLVSVIEKCLEKDPAKRYQNVAELALALLPFAPKRSRLNVERAVAVLQSAGQLDPHVAVNSTVPPPMSDAPTTSLPPAPRVPEFSAPPSSSLAVTNDLASPSTSRRRNAIIAAGTVIAAVVGVVLVLAGRSGSKEGEGAPPAATTAAAPVATNDAPKGAEPRPEAKAAEAPTEAPSDAQPTSSGTNRQAPSATGRATPGPLNRATQGTVLRGAVKGAPTAVSTSTASSEAKAQPSASTPVAKPRSSKAEEPDLGY